MTNKNIDDNLENIDNFYLDNDKETKIKSEEINNINTKNSIIEEINKEVIDLKEVKKEKIETNLITEGAALYAIDKLSEFTGIKKKPKKENVDTIFKKIEKEEKKIEKVEKKIIEEKKVEKLKQSLIEEKPINIVKEEIKQEGKKELLSINKIIKPKKIIDHPTHLEVFSSDEKDPKITFYLNIYPNNAAYIIPDLYSVIGDIEIPEKLEYNLYYITKSVDNLLMLTQLKTKQNLYKQAIFESMASNGDAMELNMRLQEIEDLKYGLVSGNSKIYEQSCILQIITTKEKFNQIYLTTLFDSIKKLDFKINRLKFLQKDIYDNILLLQDLNNSFIGKQLISNYSLESRDLPKLNFLCNSGFEDSVGIFIGKNIFNSNMVFRNIWGGSNYNFFGIGKSGGGKSYSVKTILTREYSKDVHVFIIDPEGEFKTLTKEIGGKLIDIRDNENKINPFDFNYIHGINPEDIRNETNIEKLKEMKLDMKKEFELFIIGLESLIKLILLKEKHNGENLFLIHKAIMEYYKDLGIEISKVGTYFKLQKNIGNFGDFYKKLIEIENQTGYNNKISSFLEKYINGIYYDLFGNKKTNLKFNDWTCFDFSGFDEDLRYILMFLVSRALVGFMTTPMYKDVLKRLVIDEAHLFLQDIQIVDYFLQILKRGRKYKFGIGLITQTIDDFFIKYKDEKRDGKTIGNDIINNVSFQFVFGQKGQQNLENVTEKLSLNEKESSFLSSISGGKNPGKCLFITEESGQKDVVALQIEAEDYLREIIG